MERQAQRDEKAAAPLLCELFFLFFSSRPNCGPRQMFPPRIQWNHIKNDRTRMFGWQSSVECDMVTILWPGAPRTSFICAMTLSRRDLSSISITIKIQKLAVMVDLLAIQSVEYDKISVWEKEGQK
jgi:hypothetical protein